MTLQVCFPYFFLRKCQNLSHGGNCLSTLWDSQWKPGSWQHRQSVGKEGCCCTLRGYPTAFPWVRNILCSQPEAMFEGTMILIQQEEIYSYSHALKQTFHLSMWLIEFTAAASAEIKCSDCGLKYCIFCDRVWESKFTDFSWEMQMLKIIWICKSSLWHKSKWSIGPLQSSNISLRISPTAVICELWGLGEKRQL